MSCKMEAEIGAVQTQAKKEGQGVLVATRSWKEAKKDSSLKPSEESMVLPSP